MRMELRTIREPLMPIPLYKWSDKKEQWVVRKYRRPREKWIRIDLPPHEKKNRKEAVIVRKNLPLKIMVNKDYERAVIILSIYLRSMKLETWEEFHDHRWTFEFVSYPGPPNSYLDSEIEKLTCCEDRKLHRVIDSSKPLQNPVAYRFCLKHWHKLIDMSKGKRSIRIPEEVFEQGQPIIAMDR